MKSNKETDKGERGQSFRQQGHGTTRFTHIHTLVILVSLFRSIHLPLAYTLTLHLL